MRGHDVRFWREEPECEGMIGNARSNLPERILHHSTSWVEWGYSGSGPADAALRTLALFLPVGCDGAKPVRLWKGRCSLVAWLLHQDFKREFICTLPREGGVLRADVIRQWIDQNWPGKEELSAGE